MGLPRGDSLTIAESELLALGVPRGDSVTVTESTLLGFPKSDTATLTESALVGFPKSDALNAAESTLSALGVPRGDALDIGESAPAALGVPRGDSLTITESAPAALGAPRGETTTLTEAAPAALNTPRSETTTISDTSRVFALGFTLAKDWSTFSIPIYASNNTFFATTGLGTSSQNGLVDPAKVTIAYRYNASTTAWEQILTGDTVLPLEGILVNSSESHTATVIISTVHTTPPTKTLSTGWNLVGTASLLSATGMAADQALISAFSTSSGLVGYNQVVSPSVNSTTFAWTRGAGSAPDLDRWRGYWVFMENGDTMAGFSSTPL